MRALALLVFGVCFALVPPGSAHAQTKTVCTITVNSADEKQALRRALPGEHYRFIELVERGRTDWLRSACRSAIRCDTLVISGHYDGETYFFSDRVDADEHLPVAELERVACSESCPGLFSQLQEVYLFGCNSLSPEPVRIGSPEIARSLARSGHAASEAQRLARALGARYGESSRDRMRRIFKDVPVLYGFSSVAPLGPVSGGLLGRYLANGGTAEYGRGRASTRLLSQFSTHGMAATAGATERDPDWSHRTDVCRFIDERTELAQKIRFLHALLGRDMAEVRLFLDRIEALTDALGSGLPFEAKQALAGISADQDARQRFLQFARDADQPSVRARMFAVAERFEWLTPEAKRAELIQVLVERLASPTLNAGDIGLACALNARGDLSAERVRLPLIDSPSTAQSALLACLGDAAAREATLIAFTSGRDADIAMAQVYLYHQPVKTPDEFRTLTSRIASVDAPQGQARALQTLARQPFADRESVAELARWFPEAKSVEVQRAIAGILIRSDYHSLAPQNLLQTLREHRIKSTDGRDVIDVLIRRLEAS